LKAIVYRGPHAIRVEEVPDPKLKRGDELIRFRAGSICGTDLHYFKGEWKTRIGRIIGHDASGERLSDGERVAVEPILRCGRCELCLTGRYHLCRDGSYMGMSAQGCFSELFTVPKENLHKIPENVSFEEAAILEPVALALHTFEMLKPKVGERAVILGQGPVGLLMTQVGRLCGLKIIAVDRDPHRLEVAKDLGADETVNAVATDSTKAINDLTNGGAEIVVEAAGSRHTVEQTCKIVAPAGRVALVGAFTGEMKFDGEASFFGVETGVGKYPLALQLISEGKIDVRSLITHVFPLTDFEEAIKTALDLTKKPLKVVLVT
jgi:threonine dehydrogenase-like Zn-dependent dehydrogenase